MFVCIWDVYIESIPSYFTRPQGLKLSFLSQAYRLSLAKYLESTDLLVVCLELTIDHEDGICLEPLPWCLS